MIVALLGFTGAIVAVPATAAHAERIHDHVHGRQPQVVVRVITPSEDGLVGAGGVFNVDVSLQARPGEQRQALARQRLPAVPESPGPRTRSVPACPIPVRPGLVVLESTTPQAAGVPNANLAGVFQPNAVERVHNLQTTFNDWQVGVPGFFGTFPIIPPCPSDMAWARDQPAHAGQQLSGSADQEPDSYERGDWPLTLFGRTMKPVGPAQKENHHDRQRN